VITSRESTVALVADLPLFPLGTVLFPGALLPLHIFEPRYRLLVDRCIERKAPFGVVLIRSGQEVGAGAEPHRVGTEARVVAVSPLPDGRFYIVTRGERRFAIESLVTDAEPYLVGHVRYLAEDEGPDAATGVAEALDALGAYLLGIVAVTHEQHGDRSLDDDLKAAAPPEVAYRIAAALSIDPAERQSLLELATAAERLREETRILRRETDLVRDLLVRLRARGERGGLN
jgi:Lon protease-like protein